MGHFCTTNLCNQKRNEALLVRFNYCGKMSEAGYLVEQRLTLACGFGGTRCLAGMAGSSQGLLELQTVAEVMCISVHVSLKT